MKSRTKRGLSICITSYLACSPFGTLSLSFIAKRYTMKFIKTGLIASLLTMAGVAHADNDAAYL